MKRRRGAEEEEKIGNTVEVKMGNNEENRRKKEEEVEKQGISKEDELDKFVITAMLAGVPFLKAKIKTFAKKKESRLKEKVGELEKVVDLKKRHLIEFESKNRELRQKLARVCEDLNSEKRKSQQIKEEAKTRELNAEIEVALKNRIMEKLKMENNNLKLILKEKM